MLPECWQLLAGTMILPGCSGQTETAAETDTAAEESRTEASSEAQTETQTEAAAEDAVEKPEKITFMVDGTLVTKANGQEEWVNRWEELTGIQLEIIQPDHTAYYDVLGQTIASGPDNWPDVLITTSQYYTNYAKEGVLWDMTEAWENSEIKSSGRIVNEDVVNSLYIDDHLYGLATGPGMGCRIYQWGSALRSVPSGVLAGRLSYLLSEGRRNLGGWIYGRQYEGSHPASAGCLQCRIY